MEETNILPDNVHNHWKHLGNYYPYEIDHSASTQSLIDPQIDYIGCHGCAPNLADRRYAIRQSGRTFIDEAGFQASLDVHQFAPKDIIVKIVGNSIVIEAKHDERPDEHGHVSRQFMRRYDLPKEFQSDHVVPELSSDGILTIRALPDHKILKEGRDVPIKYTGLAQFNIKDQDEGITDDNVDHSDRRDDRKSDNCKAF